VENTFNGELKDDLASLKTGSEHGLGLKSVKRSVDKYGGYMNVSHDGTMFSVSILLYGGG